MSGERLFWRDDLGNCDSNLALENDSGVAAGSIALDGTLLVATDKQACEQSSWIKQYELDPASHEVTEKKKESLQSIGIAAQWDGIYYAVSQQEYHQDVRQYIKTRDIPVPTAPPASGYTGWKTVNGKDYWYENGVKQGTTGRGKEIYDASSDAWYWLDAVDGGAKAVNKDVYQESDGGKWVRYDENGHMIKGENCQNGNWYYFEPVTGAMIHGPWTLPDGRKVYYDLTTGIMQYGNVSINGSLYYFDPVYGTMKSGALTNFWVTDGNGKSFWYESWVRQGWQPGSSNYRGKEIYDPASGAWYWLDNVQQGAKATSKEVYQDSNGGKWVRYDANGHMIKGWYTQDGKTWYYDLTTGAMYKGWHTIEGSTYHFDETTGVKG